MYTNETVHFGIPLPLGSDLTTPMDYNTAAAAVDAALFEAQTNASQAASDAYNAVDTANDAASAVGDLGGDLNTLTGRVTALEQSDVIQDNKIDNLEIKVPTKFDSVGVADAYLNGLTYAIGDVVTYNGQRYVCNTAVTAAEPFDADKWTAKDIQAELDQISGLSKVSVTADGVKTNKQLLNQLSALIDSTKVRPCSIFEVNPTGYYHRMKDMTFTLIRNTDNSTISSTAVIDNTDSAMYQLINDVYTDLSDVVRTAGHVFTFYY